MTFSHAFIWRFNAFYGVLLRFDTIPLPHPFNAKFGEIWYFQYMCLLDFQRVITIFFAPKNYRKNHVC